MKAFLPGLEQRWWLFAPCSPRCGCGRVHRSGVFPRRCLPREISSWGGMGGWLVSSSQTEVVAGAVALGEAHGAGALRRACLECFRAKAESGKNLGRQRVACGWWESDGRHTRSCSSTCRFLWLCHLHSLISSPEESLSPPDEPTAFLVTVKLSQPAV